MTHQNTYEPLTYPPAREADTSEVLHGITIDDPYRWMEDVDAKETRDWVQAEAELSQRYISAIPGRDWIADRLAKLWNFEQVVGFKRVAGKEFALRREGQQAQFVLCVRKIGEDKWTVLIDPNQLSEDGSVALSGYTCSKNGRYVTYALADAGSDWLNWHTRDLETNTDLPEVIERCKFSAPQWMQDNSGFFYARYGDGRSESFFEAKTPNHKVYFHKLGTPVEKDELIYVHKEEQGWLFEGRQTKDGAYDLILGGIGAGDENIILVRPHGSPEEYKAIVKPTASFDFLGNHGSIFYVLTNYKAPCKKIVAIDIGKPEPENWTTIVPESKETLRDAVLSHSDLVVSMLSNASAKLKHYRIDGTLVGDIELPRMGEVQSLTDGEDGGEVFFNFESFVDPTTVYSYDCKSSHLETVHKPVIDFDAEKYMTKQVFYESKDGTKIPMFLVHKKGYEPDGNTPTLLYGYGGFNVSKPPFFYPRILGWLEMGGTFALANLRGGGEFGRDWYDAGRLMNKQNAFDDFIAAGEWLIENRYTNTKKLAINGRSNGGLLVGAVLNQRPDLFGAVCPEVGVLDMLRFDQFTVGAYWVKDYGSPGKEEDFKYLLTYSPLHNIKKREYPPVIVLTGDHDDRVTPSHSFKYTATLQKAQQGSAPVLLRVDINSGHGSGKSIDKQVEESADLLAFFAKSLNMDLPPDSDSLTIVSRTTSTLSSGNHAVASREGISQHPNDAGVIGCDAAGASSNESPTSTPREPLMETTHQSQLPKVEAKSECDMQFGVKIPTRDGVELNATLYRKHGQKGPAPVIFSMTPYIADGLHQRAECFSADGFVFLAVDVRGRGNSGGKYDPFFHDGKDGADIVDWIAKQDFCNGNVSMWGGSYVGFNQWSTIKELPAALKSIAPVASVYPAFDFPYNKGSMYPYVIQWLLYTGLSTRNDNVAFTSEYIKKKFYDAYANYSPYEKLDEFVGYPCEAFQKWIKNRPGSEFWTSMVPNAEQYAKISVPILTITGQYDGDQPGAMNYYGQHMRYGNEEAKQNHYLIIGPWDHGGTRTPQQEFGGLKFGEKSVIDMDELHKQWYRWTLSDGPKPEFLKKRVAYYVAGIDEWKYVDTLEEITAEHKKLHLSSNPGQKMDAFDSGHLQSELSDDQTPDTWTYDPLDTRYGELEVEAKPEEMNNASQFSVLNPYFTGAVYHTEPFEQDTEISGFFNATLYIETDVPDTDFSVTLTEIKRDGSSVFLSGDMIRARYRNSVEKEELLTPGEVMKYEFKHFMFISRVIDAGSRLRLAIQSPNSIQRMKNYNSGGYIPAETSKDARVAHIKLYHNSKYPSCLEIPIGKK